MKIDSFVKINIVNRNARDIIIFELAFSLSLCSYVKNKLKQN